jgi:ribosomal protein L7/L12
MEKNDLIKLHYEEIYENHVLKTYRAYISNEELDDDEELLGRCILDFRRDPELLENLPESVRYAYDYYYVHIAKCDLGCVRLHQVPYEKDFTYAIRVTTDGDDGWLEIYDSYGQVIGIGRTYIELIGWGEIDEIRGQVHDFSFPESLSDKQKKTIWQFGACIVLKDSPERFSVIAEHIPDDKKDDAIKIICDATKVREKAVAIVFDCLPHSVTKNISQEVAENIWCRLTEIGVKVSIKEFNKSNRWIVFRGSDFTKND